MYVFTSPSGGLKTNMGRGVWGAEPPTAMFGFKSPSGDLKPNRYRIPVASFRTAGTVNWAPVSEPGFLKFQIFRF